MFFNRKKRTNTQFLVSIGAGINQVPLIKAAKMLGYSVIGVDINSSAQGFSECDLKIQESIEDYETINLKLQELLVDGEIVSIMTRSYGAAVKTTAYLCEKFNISYIPFEICDKYNNKKKMKSLLSDAGITIPETYKYTAKTNLDKIKKINFPLISKPNSGHGKMDVKLINNINELKKILKKDTKTNIHIFEKYIEGDEIIVIGLVHNKKFHLIEITDKTKSNPPYFVDLMHISPSKYSNMSEEIIKMGQQVSDSYHIESSPLVMEIIVTSEKKLYLLEAIPEFGGEYLSDVLIPLSTGYKIFQEAINSKKRKGFSAPNFKKKKKPTVVKYITTEEGNLISCDPLGPANSKKTKFSKILKEIGAKCVKPKTNFDRVAVVVSSGKTVQDAIENSKKAEDSLNIKVKK